MRILIHATCPIVMFLLSQTTIIFSDFPVNIWVASFMVYSFHSHTSMFLQSGISSSGVLVTLRLAGTLSRGEQKFCSTYLLAMETRAKRVLPWWGITLWLMIWFKWLHFQVEYTLRIWLLSIGKRENLQSWLMVLLHLLLLNKTRPPSERILLRQLFMLLN